MSTNNSQPVDKQGSGPGIIMRLFWMLIGNVILCISTIFIVQHRGNMFHSVDIVFWITVTSIALARYLDIKHWGGLTITGQPATSAHWTKYLILLMVCSSTVWATAHAINYLIINK